jgi:hypothetical protein
MADRSETVLVFYLVRTLATMPSQHARSPQGDRMALRYLLDDMLEAKQVILSLRLSSLRQWHRMP